ncbi:MAG TPA: efflux transporter outer membrane subunit [Opitutaceae bacterium]
MSPCRLVAGACVLSVLQAGCVTAPKSADRPVDIALPNAWTAGEASASPATSPSASEAGWLDTFGDRQLVDLVAEALARNHDLRALALTLEATRASAIIAGADKYPQIGAGLDAARLQAAVENGRGGATPFIDDSHQLGLNLSWEVDLWGRLRNREQAAIADVQAAGADFSGARLSLAANVAKAWFRTTTSRLQLDLAQETVLNFNATADLVRSRFEVGVSSSLELRLALANAASARVFLDQRRQELDSVVRTLETLVGRYSANVLATVETMPELQAEIPVGLPSDLLQRRPDIFAAERRVAGADSRARESRKAMLPALRLTGAGGTASSELENLLDSGFEVWSIAAGLVQPILQGGRLRAAADRSSILAERTHEDYVSTLLNAFREVETTLAAEETLGHQEESLREFAEHSAGAERLARDEYETGISDIITVLESQRRALDARSSHLSIREQRLRNRVDLHLALGGDFETPSAPPPKVSMPVPAAAVAAAR